MALPLVITLTVLLGFVIERAAYKPLRRAPDERHDLRHRRELPAPESGHPHHRADCRMMYPSLPGLSGQITMAGTSTKMVR